MSHIHSVAAIGLAVVGATGRFVYGGPAWDARVGLTGDQLQERTDGFKVQGYQPVFVDGYVVNGEVMYCAIWERRNGPAWDARVELTGDQLQVRTEAFKAQGYQPVLVGGYVVNGEVRYCAIWERK
jgi:hypothetical protein